MVRDERKQQVLAGFCVVAGVAGLILLIAWARYLPGLGGEFFGRILGIISTSSVLLSGTAGILAAPIVRTGASRWRKQYSLIRPANDCAKELLTASSYLFNV